MLKLIVRNLIVEMGQERLLGQICVHLADITIIAGGRHLVLQVVSVDQVVQDSELQPAHDVLDLRICERVATFLGHVSIAHVRTTDRQQVAHLELFALLSLAALDKAASKKSALTEPNHIDLTARELGILHEMLACGLYLLGHRAKDARLITLHLCLHLILEQFGQAFELRTTAHLTHTAEYHDRR